MSSLNSDSPLIELVSTVKGLELLKEVAPGPASKFIPNWWKTTETFKGFVNHQQRVSGNVKTCPSFPDYLSSGVIIPMWADVLLYFNEETKSWAWKSPSSEFDWGIHDHYQFLESVPFEYLGKKAKIVFKATSPWKLITPPGYSVLQLPVFYHYTNDFVVMPGIVDTDRHHIINQQLLFLSDKKEFIIERGTPFVQYVPFKREPFKTEVRYQTEKDIEKFNYNILRLSSKFDGSSEYMKQRKRDIEESENE